jgi:nitrite reductase (NADH) large subunit
VGVETIRQQIMDDVERRRALYDRFALSQTFSQRDPWTERAAGKDAHEFTPVADLRVREAAE